MGNNAPAKFQGKMSVDKRKKLMTSVDDIFCLIYCLSFPNYYSCYGIIAGFNRSFPMSIILHS